MQIIEPCTTHVRYVKYNDTHKPNYTSEKTKEAIKNGQSRDVDNIERTRHRTNTNKTQTQHNT